MEAFANSVAQMFSSQLPFVSSCIIHGLSATLRPTYWWDICSILINNRYFESCRTTLDRDALLKFHRSCVTLALSLNSFFISGNLDKTSLLQFLTEVTMPGFLIPGQGRPGQSSADILTHLAAAAQKEKSARCENWGGGNNRAGPLLEGLNQTTTSRRRLIRHGQCATWAPILVEHVFWHWQKMGKCH